MSYKVIAPLVVIANDDGKTGDFYGYSGALVPEGWNDERCKVLTKEGFLEKVSAPKADAADADDAGPKPDSVEGIIAAVGEDKAAAAAALEQEKAGKNRKTLVESLEKLLAS